MRLSRFIAVCFIVILVLWSVLTSYAISALYGEGLDDSSHFYLWKDAQFASQYYQQHQKLPQNDDFRAYYQNIQQLPKAYRTQIQSQSLSIHQPILLTFSHESVYLLPFYLPQQQNMAVVLHRFTAADDEGYTVSKFSSVLWWFIILGIPCGSLMAYFLYKAIAAPLAELSVWSQGLSTQDDLQALNPNALKFMELQELAQLLYQAFMSVKESNQREKQFLQTLSHELRTPLATTQATLDVLERQLAQNNQPLYDKLQRIRRANSTMQELSTALLWLWHQPNSTLLMLEYSEVNLNTVIDECWQELQHLSNKTQQLEKHILPTISVHGSLPLLKVIIYNLLKNAQQYSSQQAVIKLQADNQHLSVINAKTQETEQGFGIGLNLVQHISQRMNWQCVIEQDTIEFRVIIIFKS